MAGVDVVEQVVVKVLDAGLAALFVEDPVPVFLGLHELGRELAGQGEAVPGMAGDQGLFRGILALEAAVHPGSVEIGKPFFDKGVHHLFGQLDVDGAGIVGV